MYVDGFLHKRREKETTVEYIIKVFFGQGGFG